MYQIPSTYVYIKVSQRTVFTRPRNRSSVAIPEKWVLIYEMYMIINYIIDIIVMF